MADMIPGWENTVALIKVRADLARVMEQRDSARHMLGLAERQALNLEAEVERLEADLARVHEFSARMRNDRDIARAERDAACRLTDKWKEIVDKVATWGDRLKRDRDEARHLACRMLTERNAAVEALGKDREDKPRALAAMKKTVAFTKRMIAERDKAQEHAEEMGDIVERALTKLEFEQVVDRWHRNMIDKLANERDAPKAMNDLQPCGHPRSAIVSIPDDLGGDPSHYCGMCNAEAEAEVRRDTG